MRTSDPFVRLIRIRGPEWEHRERFQRAIDSMDALDREVARLQAIVDDLVGEHQGLKDTADEANRRAEVAEAQALEIQTELTSCILDGRAAADERKAMVAALAKARAAVEVLAKLPGPSGRVQQAEDALVAIDNVMRHPKP